MSATVGHGVDSFGFRRTRVGRPNGGVGDEAGWNDLVWARRVRPSRGNSSHRRRWCSRPGRAGMPGRRPSVATLATAAAEAGVSRQTVSNALNSPDLLRPDTLARVQLAID